MSISYSITVLVRKGSMGKIACKILPSVRIKLYVKSEVDACRSVSVMTGQIDTFYDI